MTREPAPLTAEPMGGIAKILARKDGGVSEQAPAPVTHRQGGGSDEADYDEVFGDEALTEASADSQTPAPITAQPQTLGEMQALIRAGGEDGGVVETDAPVVFEDSLAESGASTGASLAARMLG